MIKLVLLLSALVALTLARPEGRIVNGKDAKPGQFPHQVLLRSQKSFICGGSVLNKRWVLTAAHCVDGSNAADLDLFTGTVDAEGANGALYQVAKYFVHESYGNFKNDIALMKVDRDIQFNEFTQPITLATSLPSFSDEAIVSGFGRLVNGGAVAKTLQYTTTSLLSQEQCGRETGIKHEGTICVFAEKGRGVCNGDSGGPAVYTKNGKQVLFGVANFVIGGCAFGKPDGFASVVYYTKWVQSTMAQN